ncbi:MAG: ABC transporter ATP-binding protein [Lachnospiraceae bacterium]|nr:ABC transporter ATP-binding protein [Lachnospiraceae bacterium]
MKWILKYMGRYRLRVALTMSVKFFGTIGELVLPFLLEYIIDDVVPDGKTGPVVFYGLLMILTAVVVRTLNVSANRRATSVARDCIRDLRHDLFTTTTRLTGSQFDYVTLPSLISRMTSDTYNVQNFIGMIQRMGVRACILLLGSIMVSSLMDPFLALVLLCMVPVMAGIILFISVKGIPMYRAVQEKVDTITRVLRENITGIRVVKALSREPHETERYAKANDDLTSTDLRTGITMAIPNPVMNLCLNIGLTLVIIFGARRVNAGVMAPGVILAFLTYFNMILQAIMGMNRIFIQSTKAAASANRIGEVLLLADDQPPVLPADEAHTLPESMRDQNGRMPLVVFDNVSFSYPVLSDANVDDTRENAISGISFSLRRGERLGVIGATGCGKTTLLNLLMRFYDTEHGQVFYDGRDVRTYAPGDLRRPMSVVFQNDTIFADTLESNIKFGREVTDDEMRQAAEDANIATMIESQAERYQYAATKAGANLSGGEKQRILISRALAGHPDLLLLDDASSALDYKTDAALRRAIREHYPDTTTITIAQRISSVMSMDRILVMENGQMLGYGTHEELLATCEVYRDIYISQTGGEANATA